MSEFEFINEITKKTGCYVLLDVNNIWCNAINFKEDPLEVISTLKKNSVKGYHLAGCSLEHMGNGPVYIDYHKEAVHDEVWTLYKNCLERFGPWPTLLEWENNVPKLERTLEEVQKINKYLRPYAAGVES